MGTISFSDGVGIGGVALAVVLLVLDKAGKLKGGWLIGLLCLAAAMTLFIAVGNSLVLDAPSKWRVWRGALMVSLVGLAYSGLALWISGPPDRTTAAQRPPTQTKVESSPAFVARILIARADPLYRFYQHPPFSYDRITTELYVEITNQTEIPIYIQGYSVLALIRGQQWREFQNLPMFGLEPDEVGAIAPDRKYFNRFDLRQNGFDYLIRKGPIGAHQAIQAWMFFASGLSEQEVFQVTQFRITLLDSTEKKYVLFSDYPSVSGNFAVGSLKVLQREPVPTGLHEDIPSAASPPTTVLLEPRNKRAPSATREPRPRVARLTVSQESEVSTRDDAPYYYKVVVATTETIPDLNGVTVLCDGPVAAATWTSFKFDNTVSIPVRGNTFTWRPNLMVELSPAVLSPSEPFTFHVWSKQPINCTSAEAE